MVAVRPPSLSPLPLRLLLRPGLQPVPEGSEGDAVLKVRGVGKGRGEGTDWRGNTRVQTEGYAPGLKGDSEVGEAACTHPCKHRGRYRNKKTRACSTFTRHLHTHARDRQAFHSLRGTASPPLHSTAVARRW